MRIWAIGRDPLNDRIKRVFPAAPTSTLEPLVYYLILHHGCVSLLKYSQIGPAMLEEAAQGSKDRCLLLSPQRTKALRSYEETRPSPTTTRSPPASVKAQIHSSVRCHVCPMLPLLHGLRSLLILNHTYTPHCCNLDKSLIPQNSDLVSANCLSSECQIHCVVLGGGSRGETHMRHETLPFLSFP